MEGREGGREGKWEGGREGGGKGGRKGGRDAVSVSERGGSPVHVDFLCNI